MPEETPPTKFEFDLADYGGLVEISSPEELRKWNDDEFRAWEWVNIPQTPQIDEVFQRHQNFADQVRNYANQWASYSTRPEFIPEVFNGLGNLFQENYCKRAIFHSSNPDAAFLSELREKSGVHAAGGAYLALLGGALAGGWPMRLTLFEGMFEAFLYKRAIDWTASAHTQALNELKQHYEANLSAQDKRFKEVETTNSVLNKTFEDTLKEKSAALQKLHGDQSSDFEKLVNEHQKNLKLIEITYDQKLALQKPVKYWKTKEGFHSGRARVLGWSALLAGLALIGGMGGLVYWVFSGLNPNDNPKHWQIGILIVAAFFSVWIVRVLIRMFFSHLHLATDAAERRTMILTYLAMSREGAQFAKEDKTLIIQHLFRSASDGYVKDDAAPPSVLEFFTRGK